MVSKNLEGVCFQNSSGNKLYNNEISYNERYGIDTCECKDNNEYNMNRIKNNVVGFYIEESNDNLTGENLLENNGKNIEKASPTNVEKASPTNVLSLIFTVVAFIVFLLFIVVSFKNKKL